LFEVLFPSFPKSWLQTLRDVAPLIGAAVMIIIAIAIVLFAVWWYRYWVRKGIKEYERQHGEVRLQL
jgi:cbb3-type cytochrome oxidase subunit 3